MSDLFDDINQHLLDNDDSKLVTGKEVETLILSLANARGEEGFTEEECVAMVRWAERARLDAILLGFILDGTCDINLQNGEIAVKITEAGKYLNESQL